MIDFIYVLATIVFFALMIAYVGACDALGRRNSSGESAAKE